MSKVPVPTTAGLTFPAGRDVFATGITSRSVESRSIDPHGGRRSNVCRTDERCAILKGKATIAPEETGTFAGNANC